ncbi:wax ester/triacylglycerol synthase domain-containing protein [Krasilnikovia cinnamomea]|uniref:wax ester/triacylglycerol synthase domain-containing protein n=1 Tax=Krasilnikovia cinnamomea TaxID=349313 RepID=UPI0013EF4218|nr:wax ester/triacylglycerol synthase domain-containing protein [Krasilnikovia cinnamomea]
MRASQQVARPRPDRAGNADLAFLAMGHGTVPEQFAAVLVLDADPGVAVVERTLAARAPSVRRLRQRLIGTPPGCGRPVWVDDADFDVRRHVRHLPCRPPGDLTALVDTALTQVISPLSLNRPLWRAAYVTGLSGGGAAVVLVLHHVLADGIGGLAILADLVDGAAGSVPPPPAPAPSTWQLAADAAVGRLQAIRRFPAGWRQFRESMTAGGGFLAPAATRCSLLATTGRDRRAAIAEVALPPVRIAAHAHGGTVNAALLTAIAGGLCTLLHDRGETVDRISIALPVTARHRATRAELGNQVSPLLLTVRGSGPLSERIREVATAVRRRRSQATGPAPIALLGPAFRWFAAVGGYRWYLRRQHRLHTVVSFVRGPDTPIRIAGTRVRSIIPLGVGEAGNITIAFQALSYADTLTVTALADPHRVSDLDNLMTALRSDLDRIAAAPLNMTEH